MSNLTRNFETEQTTTGGETMKKYTCTNCGDKADNKYIRAMIKAGFEARHLDCRTCGQGCVVDAEKGLRANKEEK